MKDWKENRKWKNTAEKGDKPPGPAFYRRRIFVICQRLFFYCGKNLLSEEYVPIQRAVRFSWLKKREGLGVVGRGRKKKRERTLFACYLPLLHRWLPLQFQGLWRTQFSIGDHFATIFDVRACLLGDVEMNFVAFHPWRKAQEDVIFKRQKKMCEGFFSPNILDANKKA